MSKRDFKVFSINTTIRNPKRNVEFLKAFEKFNGCLFNEKIAQLYLIELIKQGIYKLSNTPKNIIEKLDDDVELTKLDIEILFKLNQHISSAEKIKFRVGTQLQSLKDQGFLIYENDKIFMSKFAFDLIQNKISSIDIYSKLMIGLHANNPQRSFMLNQARVFLNTIFVIDLLKKEWRILGNEAKGILRHEFKSFVLGMKDCDYKKCVSEILKYRAKFKYGENKEYIKDYLFNKMELYKTKYQNLNDYADDVFRKFEMTGLLVKRGAFEHIYYDFSHFNMEKICSILENFKDYKFETFANTNEYMNFIDNIKLPWIYDENVRKGVILQKAKTLNIEIKELNFDNLEQLENNLNQRFYNSLLQNKIEMYELNDLINELKILAKNQQSSHKDYKDLPNPLRLEYLLALILGKKYGVENLYSNLIYSENGEPLSYAPAGKADLEYQDFLLEATMIKNRNQQLNSETTSIARHMKETQDRQQKPLRTMLIAPYIHWDVALFFKFCAKEFESKIAPLSIQNFIQLIESSPDFKTFQSNFDGFVRELLDLKTDEYIKFIHSTHIDSL